MGRLKVARSKNGSEDDAGLAGWLYTDLLLGLAVVFLAGTAFVVPKLVEEEPAAEAAPEESMPLAPASTTTTIPVDYCTSLYSVDGADKKESGIWVVVDNSSDSDDVVLQFANGLRAELDAENPTLISQGKKPWVLSDLKIGLMLVYGGFPGDQTAAVGANNARGAFDAIRYSGIRSFFDSTEEFPESIQRYFGTTTVGENQVGFEVFPYIESPC